MALTSEQSIQMEFLNRLKFPYHASRIIVNQGFVGLKVLKELEDTEVENLCKIIRTSGATRSTEFSSKSTADNGSSVPMLAENNLKPACYFVRHKMER
eukprot:6735500-Ditylum_brightwellii.AAC.1